MGMNLDLLNLSQERKSVILLQNIMYKKKSRIYSAQVAAEGVRDVFGRIILVASQLKSGFNLKHLLSFPITEVPLSLAHSNGSPLKTDKCKLLKVLEMKQLNIVTTENLPNITATIIDEGLLLHTVLNNSSGSYGAIARELLRNVCSYAGDHIHFLFDKYI